MNKLFLIGRVATDIELKQAGQTSVVEFKIATNDGTKDKPQSNFHNVKAFGKYAEIIEKYVKKGHVFSIVGRVTYESWEKDGAKHYKTVVVVDSIELLPQKERIESNDFNEVQNESVNESVSEDLPF